jgi:hypothetical protein
VDNAVWQAVKTRAILVFLYVAGFASCIIGSHLFMVAYDPGSVGGLYLFPFALSAPAELVPTGGDGQTVHTRDQAGPNSPGTRNPEPAHHLRHP